MHVKGSGILTVSLRMLSFISVVQLPLAYFQTWGSLLLFFF